MMEVEGAIDKTDDPKTYDLKQCYQLVDLSERGRHCHDVELVFEAISHLGGLSSHDEGCKLLKTVTFFSSIMSTLAWSIDGGNKSTNTLSTLLPHRRARAQSKDQMKHQFYCDRITTITLRLLFNLVQSHCNERLNESGVEVVRRILIAEGIDRCVTNLATQLITYMSPNQPLCPAWNKSSHFEIALQILSRAVELESVRNIFVDSVEQVEEKERLKKEQEMKELGERRGRRRKSTTTTEEDEKMYSGMDLMFDIITLTTSLSFNQFNYALRAISLLIKWNEYAKEKKSIQYIEPTVEILEEYLGSERSERKERSERSERSERKEAAAADGVEQLVMNAFGLFSSMTYKSSSPIMEKLLLHNVGSWSVQCFLIVYENNVQACVQILGFLSSFLVQGGPKVALSMVDVLLNKKLIQSILTCLQLNTTDVRNE